MKNKNIFIVVSQNIDKRNFDRFGYQVYKKKGWKVKTIYLENEKQNKDLKTKDIIFKPIYINNVIDVFRKTKKIKDSIIYYLCNETFLQMIMGLYLLINNNILILRYDVIPSGQVVKKKISFYLKKNILKKIFQVFSLYLVRFINNIIYFFYKKKIVCCVVGNKSLEKIKSFFVNKVFTHTYDYDIFLNDQKRKKAQTKIVFLDQYEENHPDYERINIKPVTKKIYFESLNKFFDIVEKKYNKQIIIAGHPRSLKDSNRNFGGRKIIYNNTYKLIKNSFFVIAHDTTALNFACLLKKSILLIYTNEMKQNNFKINSILNFSSALGVEPINIDKINNKTLKLNNKIDKKKYVRYINDYISSNKKNLKSNEILEEYLNNFVKCS
tara:strand:- start:9244 stop:10389 length:1146 start_codon:yes stop_codon:yes gene_type:complete